MICVIFVTKLFLWHNALFILIVLQPGTKVMILPNAPEDKIKEIFPEGIDEVHMPSGQLYIRSTENYKF